MHRARADHADPKSAPTGSAWLSRITSIAFAVAVAIVAARAGLAEHLRDPIELAPEAPRAAGPATSLLLDLACWVPALLVLLRRVVDRGYYLRWSWVYAPAGLLGAWMVLSAAWADDRFAAIVDGFHFASAMAVLFAASQLVRSWRRLRLVGAVLAGILLLYLAAGIEYRLLDVPSMRQRWFEAQRKEILEQHGWAETDFAFRQFEQKVLAGEIMGFSASPNTYAAVVVMLGCVIAGAAIQRFAHRDHPAWGIVPVALLAPIAYVLYHTHSRTAIALSALAALLFLGIWLLRSFLARQARRLYWAGVIAFVLGTGAMIGHGLYHHGAFPEQSLTNRWRYWTGAARLMAESPVLGVGWSNFGQDYLRVRLPVATEEVKDPHNLFVRALVELGIPGGLLMVLLIGRLWYELSRASSPQLPAEQPAPSPLRWALVIAALAMAVNALAGIDFELANPALTRDLAELSGTQAYLVNEVFRRVAGAMLLAAGALLVMPRTFLEQKQVRPVMDDRPAPWVLYGGLIGLGMFLLHNLIDFALFETSALFPFALLAGAVLGARQPLIRRTRRHDRVAWGAMGGMSLAWIVVAIALWAPTASAEGRVEQARLALAAGQPRLASDYYLLAFRRQPLNAEHAFAAARAGAGNMSSLQVQGLIETAIQANPGSVKYRAFQGAYAAGQAAPDYQAARYGYERALELDPYNVALRLDYARALEAGGDMAAAREQYRKALAHDDLLPASEPKRLSEKVRQSIEKTLASPSPPATAPAIAPTP